MREAEIGESKSKQNREFNETSDFAKTHKIGISSELIRKGDYKGTVLGSLLKRSHQCRSVNQ